MVKKLIEIIKILTHPYIKRINTLEIENDHLKETIKDELYIKFMAKLNESVEVQRLRERNRKLNNDIKKYKDATKSNLKAK